MTKPTVSLTQDFRLLIEERSFTLQRRVTVDPTKSPSWAERFAKDPTLSTEQTVAWRDDGYYSLSAVGLTAAIQNAVIRQAASDVPASVRLADFCGRVAEEMRKVTAVVDRLLDAKNYGEVAV